MKEYDLIIHTGWINLNMNSVYWFKITQSGLENFHEDKDLPLFITRMKRIVDRQIEMNLDTKTLQAKVLLRLLEVSIEGETGIEKKRNLKDIKLVLEEALQEKNLGKFEAFIDEHRYK